MNDKGEGKVFRYVQIAGQECKNHRGSAVPMREKIVLITGLCNKVFYATVLRIAEASYRNP
jgi:hypothetical protein